MVDDQVNMSPLEVPMLSQELKCLEYSVSELDLSAFGGTMTVWQFHRYLLSLEGE